MQIFDLTRLVTGNQPGPSPSGMPTLTADSVYQIQPGGTARQGRTHNIAVNVETGQCYLGVSSLT